MSLLQTSRAGRPFCSGSRYAVDHHTAHCLQLSPDKCTAALSNSSTDVSVVVEAFARLSAYDAKLLSHDQPGNSTVPASSAYGCCLLFGCMIAVTQAQKKHGDTSSWPRGQGRAGEISKVRSVTVCGERGASDHRLACTTVIGGFATVYAACLARQAWHASCAA